MNRIHSYIVFIACMCIVSCISYNDNGYRMLSQSQKSKIIECSLPIDSLSYDGNVYLVSVEKMRDYISHHTKVLIYEYGAYCKSDFCISPRLAEEKSHAKGYDFCLLLDSYDYLLQFPKTKTPVLAPDPASFGLEPTKACSDKMFKELSDNHLKKEDYGRFYVFKEGQYVKNIINIDDLQ